MYVIKIYGIYIPIGMKAKGQTLIYRYIDLTSNTRYRNGRGSPIQRENSVK